MIFRDLLLWVSLHCIITAYFNIIYIQGPHDSSFVTEAVLPVKISVVIIYYYYYVYRMQDRVYFVSR